MAYYCVAILCLKLHHCNKMNVGYSAMIIIMERTEGLLDRTWIAGVTPGEFALAHFLVSLVVNLLQVAVTLVFMILIFQVSEVYYFFESPPTHYFLYSVFLSLVWSTSLSIFI